jgi:hypothetical protein
MFGLVLGEIKHALKPCANPTLAPASINADRPFSATAGLMEQWHKISESAKQECNICSKLKNSH